MFEYTTTVFDPHRFPYSSGNLPFLIPLRYILKESAYLGLRRHLCYQMNKFKASVHLAF